ncbi:indole-3-glycerol phosphate synthase TrpC [Priestia koreensis]|uniref:indole-3-glycerol phosphate synthase TrpC n=1 Tax=Priestia koreensis TaxID=284581 RepID=UPI00203DE6E3|nr:indole-3-glycerol phosphate synthase TrpC [Priestia koreensis]MCM3003913.1 indole-3-glycerol phosphate synthase TrpC [Priestia koreensis]
MLDKILQTKKEEVEALILPEKQEVKKVSFYDALKNPTHTLALIAEVKRASPSKGLIKEDFNHVQIARDYEAGLADALSVLTDQQYFMGNQSFLTDIKKTVNLPVLRKDFIIDPLQVEESVRIGADAILLIGEALEPAKLHELYVQAKESGLDCLVEVHALDTLTGILDVFTPQIVGINNRDLHTFVTSVEQTRKIASYVPKESLIVSESGIVNTADILSVKEAGAEAVLVGETLMRESNQTEAIAHLFGVKHANR